MRKGRRTGNRNVFLECAMRRYIPLDFNCVIERPSGIRSAGFLLKIEQGTTDPDFGEILLFAVDFVLARSTLE
jgi:hypothetical protein